MSDQAFLKKLKILPPSFLWVLITLYVLLIPNAIIVYRYIEGKFGLVFAGKIPFVIIILFGLAFIAYLRLSRIKWKNVLYLIPCAVIVTVILNLEDNPNKHIHIPEYVLLAWLLYAAMSRDYRGKGLFILIFLCASLLGVVDELEQGIHPGRSYGWSDMLVNSSSALIGVFSILGLTRRAKPSGWDWLRDLKAYSGQLIVIATGLTGVVLMCVNLFHVQSAGGVFHGVYPPWLLAWSFFYMISTPLFVYTHRSVIAALHPVMITTKMWTYPILAILYYMHFLMVFVAITGVMFK